MTRSLNCAQYLFPMGVLHEAESQFQRRRWCSDCSDSLHSIARLFSTAERYGFHALRMSSCRLERHGRETDA